MAFINVMKRTLSIKLTKCTYMITSKYASIYFFLFYRSDIKDDKALQIRRNLEIHYWEIMFIIVREVFEGSSLLLLIYIVTVLHLVTIACAQCIIVVL